ncbi:MAG: DJ-1 family glyoxalase III [Anaerohalosphaeraceae bacterium]
MPKTALVPIADGTEELEAVTIIDVLRRGGVQVTVASVQSLQIKASRDVNLTADCLIGDCWGKTYDLIALPGGMPGAEHLRDCAVLTELLKKQKKEGRWIAAICASPAVVLAHHGLLDDCRATCYPSMQDKLPSAQSAPVVVDKTCITSQGPGTAIPFALELVSRLHGRNAAEKVAAAMLVKWAPVL